MDLIVNAISAQMGGMLTYTRAMAETIGGLIEARDTCTLVVPAPIAGYVHSPAQAVTFESPPGIVRRLVAEFETLDRIIRDRAHPVVFAAANFSLVAPSVPQMVLVRNAIYFDPQYQEHVLPTLSPAATLEYWARRALCIASADKAGVVLTPSETMRSLLVAAAPNVAARTEVAQYGIDLRRFVATGPPDTTDHLRVICHSHVALHKVTWPIVEGVKLARARGADVRLTLVDDASADRRFDRDRRAIADGLREGWLTVSSVAHAQIPALLHRHDLFAIHTLTESYGHPYLEAQAAGLACVVSDIPIAREMCGNAARYTPIFDAAAFADAFESFANDDAALLSARQLAAARAALATRSWREHFTQCVSAARRLAS